MSKFRDDTAIGGSHNRFETTEWTQIFQYRLSDAKRRGVIIDNLIRKYWKPVYFYLCQHNYDSEKAKDLTQSFFCEVVLSRNLLGRADRSKGRFRNFLLTALRCYLSDTYRKETAECRRPQMQSFQIPVETLSQLPESVHAQSPEQLFGYIWAVDLIEAVIQQTQAFCELSGKQLHWKLFEAHTLSPIRNQTPPVGLKSLCDEFQIAGQDRASNMIITVKRCFRRILEEHLSQYAQDNSSVEAEIKELFSLFESGCAG
ncbi:MAG: hypothetical protein ABFD91_18690 [Anaerohalosphaeraceae bacterium]